jgi:hypothetical protein
LHELHWRKAERNVSDQVVVRAIAVAIAAPGDAGDQLCEVEQSGLWLAENDSRHGRNAIDRHERRQNGGSSRAKRMTGDDCGL